MKKSLILTFICIISFSCVKEELLIPKILIKFGHISGNGNVVHAANYENQKSILYSELDTALTVWVTEYDLDYMDIDPNILDDPGNLEFIIYVNTSQDLEIFNNKNVYSIGRGGGRNISGNISSIEYVFVLPVRKSGFEQGNGKIEVSNGNDYIRVSYESKYSTLSKVKTLEIIPFPAP